jgi:apolipoprotein N-acyltransferase
VNEEYEDGVEKPSILADRLTLRHGPPTIPAGMSRDKSSNFLRAGDESPAASVPFTRRWYGRLVLLLVSVGLLTAGFAPVGQFYLAWFGLVPWLLVVHGTRSHRSVFFWGWVGGTLFFIANMWWMAFVTIPGMIALMAMLGLYWGAAGVIIRAAGVLRRPDEIPPSRFGFVILRLALLAAIWIAAAEWFRGSWPWHGLPWLYLGHTQSTALWICQIADITGVAGISFLLVMVNGWIALWMLNGHRIRGLVPSAVIIVALAAATIGYGLFRFQTEKFTAGPKVVLVQPNYPQDPSGQKGAPLEDMLAFHFDETRKALTSEAGVDLVAWSETMLPPINARQQFTPGSIVDQTNQKLMNLAYLFHIGVLAGGSYWDDIHTEPNGRPFPADSRNVTYYYERQGMLSDLRYDKSHLVPFGEFVPFKDGFPALHDLIVRLGPPDMKYYELRPGDEDQPTVFDLPRADPAAGSPWRICTPICFEDIDAALCARMCRPQDDSPDQKRAEILVNLTNDGWFAANENSQHLQTAIFRSIENRVPMARAVNTGISGFIDPLGRMSGLLPARADGVSIGVLQLCSRVTFFTAHGPVFSWLCAAVTGITVLKLLIGWSISARK